MTAGDSIRIRHLAGSNERKDRQFGGFSKRHWILYFYAEMRGRKSVGENILITDKGRLQLVRATYWFTKHWLPFVLVLFGFYNLLPMAAPVAMQTGWLLVGNAIYDLYSTQCHQMAQRSFFLFGEQPMYNLEQLPISLTGNTLADTFALRNFRGNETLGWKVAWSDRMVYMYGTLWIVVLIYWLSSRDRDRKPLSLWIFVLLLLPLAVDGLTHFLSDTNGLAGGFRYDNAWLAAVTNHSLPTTFYQGDGWGSFNSLIRLISGALFAVAIGGLLLPVVDIEMKRSTSRLGDKLTRYYQRADLTANL